MKKLLSIALTLIMVLSLGTYSFAATSTQSTSGVVRLEAEDGQLTGSAQIDTGDTASKGKFISYIDQVGNSVTFKNVSQSKSISIGYSRGNSGPGKMSLYLNNVHSQDISFPETGDWYGFQTCTLNIDIPAGASIKFQFDNGDAAINIDYVDFSANTLDATVFPSPAAPADTTAVTAAIPAPAVGVVRLEAESAVLTGSAQLDTGDTASKGSFVSYIDEVGNSVTFNNVPKAKALSIRYSRGNDGPGKMSLYLNNVHSKDITFPETGDWYGFANCIVPIDIPMGTNIKLQFDNGDDAINIDYIDLDTNSAAPAATTPAAVVTTPAAVTTPPAVTTPTEPAAKPAVEPTTKPAAKPVAKPTPTPVTKPAAKPVKITANMRTAAKALVAQVKKLASVHGQGLAGMVSKNGLAFVMGYGGDGIDYQEINLTASMIGKNAKGYPTIKVGTDVISLNDSLPVFNAIKTSPKLNELALSANIDTLDAFKKANNVTQFLGVMYQPNGVIITGGWDSQTATGLWMFFKKEGTQYKLFRIINIQV